VVGVKIPLKEVIGKLKEINSKLDPIVSVLKKPESKIAGVFEIACASFPRHTPPTFCQPWSRFLRKRCFAKPLSGLAKHRQQPKCYANHGNAPPKALLG
jgi:hypothetical protein